MYFFGVSATLHFAPLSDRVTPDFSRVKPTPVLGRGISYERLLSQEGLARTTGTARDCRSSAAAPHRTPRDRVDRLDRAAPSIVATGTVRTVEKTKKPCPERLRQTGI